MNTSDEHVRGFQEAWHNAYGEELDDDQAGIKFDQLLSVYRRLREFDRRTLTTPTAVEGNPTRQRWRSVVAYVVYNGTLMVMQALNCSQGQTPLIVPHGAAWDAETNEEAIIRIVSDLLNADFAVTRSLGSTLYECSNDIHDRHFFLVEPTSPLPKRSWVRSAGGMRFEFSWLPIDHTVQLDDGLGALLCDMKSAA